MNRNGEATAEARTGVPQIHRITELPAVLDRLHERAERNVDPAGR